MVGTMSCNIIILTYTYAGSGENGWTAKVPFQDAGFGTSEGISTEGELITRYATRASDVEGNPAVVTAEKILADVKKFGIDIRYNTLVFVSNREDDELEKDGIPFKNVPQEDIEALKTFATSNGFDIGGI